MYREWMDVKGKDKRSFLEGKRILPEGNYCYPFFWLRQGRRQELPGRIQEVIYWKEPVCRRTDVYSIRRRGVDEYPEYCTPDRIARTKGVS